MLEESLSIAEKQLSPDHPLVSRTLTSLGYLYLDLNDTQRAEPPLRAVQEITVKTRGADSSAAATSDLGIASLRSAQQRYPEAMDILQKSLRTLTRIDGPTDPTVFNTHKRIASLKLTLGSISEADAYSAKSSGRPSRPIATIFKT